MGKYKYYYAYDPKVKRRVVHVLMNGYLVSMITGHKFKFNEQKAAKQKCVSKK